MPTKASAKAKALANSRPLLLHRGSGFPAADRAVELVFEHLRSKKPRIRQAHKVPLKVVILDLYTAWVHDPRRYLGYSRDAGYYKAASRYNPHRIGYSRLVYVVDALKDLQLISSEPGFFDRNSGQGRRSRMRANTKLIRLVEDKAGLRPEMIGRAPGEEVIILRDQKKHDIEYRDTTETESLRERVRLINRLLASHRINLHLSDDRMKDLARRLNRDPDKYPIDFTRTQLRRIFSNGSFDQGGRFYGGWWQEIPSEYRQFIEINEKHTIEIDFGGFHPRLLYAREGIHYPGDPYQIPVPGFLSGNGRAVVKVALNILLNAPTWPAAVGAIRNKYPQYSNTKVQALITAIRQAHPKIAHHLHSGIGLTLQRLDSDLLQDIMLTMAWEHGVLVLPVHDSFIVRTSNDEELSEVMTQCYQKAVRNLAVQPVLTDKPITRGNGGTSLHDVFNWLDTYREFHKREQWLRKRAQAAPPRNTWRTQIDTVLSGH